MVLKPSHSHLPKHDLPEASRLPHWANGTFEFDVDEYIEWRAKEEGIDLKTLCARGNGRAFNAKAAAAAAAAALKESMGGGEGAAAIEVITAKALIEGDADAGASAVKHGGVSKRGSGRGLFSTTRWKRKLPCRRRAFHVHNHNHHFERNTYGGGGCGWWPGWPRRHTCLL